MGFENGGSQLIGRLPPREDTPLLHRSEVLSSKPKTFANVFIAIVGSGVLGLPYTFKRTGWVFGALMILFVGAITYHCMMLLVHTRRKVELLRGCAKISSFGDLGFAVCGPVGRFSVDAMIILSQAGFCAAYLIFIANTLSYLLNHVPGNVDPRVLGLAPKSFYIWASFPFQLGLNSIPTLTHLAPLSIFADVIDVGAMGLMMAEDVRIYLKQRPVLYEFGGFSVFFYGLGVAVYAFEGIGMVLPIESEAKDKGEFGKILAVSMVFIAVMFGSFGILGYFAFGDETKDIITTNFGRGIVSYTVQVGLCVNLFLTFPLMMNPVFEVVERRFCEGKYCLWARWGMVLLVSMVAILVPNFADFLSLVGSSVCTVLAFVLPASFHWLVFKEEMDWAAAMLDVVVIIVGIIITVSGTWMSLIEIFNVKS